MYISIEMSLMSVVGVWVGLGDLAWGRRGGGGGGGGATLTVTVTVTVCVCV